MPAVTFSNVTKRYADGTAAVSNLNLAIADGEYICFLGPSGCGKSSTLRMLAGLEAVTDGEIALEGRRINEVPPRERDMAMVFENYALYPHLDVFGNIAMPLVARGRPRAEIVERVAAVAETLKLGSMLKMRPYHLSGGQRQRVAVGRAIIREPKIFLMDEPFGHLEAYLRVQLRTEVRRLHERLGATTVHITHDQEEAAAVSDRIAVLDKGQLQQVGTIIELLDAPANRFVAEFIGSPPINILPAVIVDSAGGIAARVGDTTLPLPTDRWGWLRRVKVEGPVSLGIRPEDASIAPEGTSRGLPARVAALEPQGIETVLIAETPAGRFSLRVPSATTAHLGATVRIEANGAKVHLFGADGASLLAAHGTAARSGSVMSEVVLSNISKSFGNLKLFDGISLTCPVQQYLCLIGPSGCGKTTLMRMVAGLEHPDAGDIMIGGQRVNDLAPAERDIGLAFQNYALYPHLTVAGNLAFPLRAPIRKGRYSTTDIEQRIAEVAKLLRIETLLGRAVTQLSGGQQQRVALGRSLICNPRVLLLDEPIAHLDARLRYETRAELKQLHRRVGTTTIHVTHDQLEAMSIADLIAVIKDGAVQQLGPPLELYDKPRNAFVASFIGDPPMSLLKATLVTEAGRPALSAAGALLPLPPGLAPVATVVGAREVLVGLRPPQVHLVGDGEANAIPAIVYSHESIGRRVELMLAVADSLLRYRSEAVRKVRVGESVRVKLSLDGARVFDRSGAALQ